MPLREQSDAGVPLVVTDPDDPAAQSIRQAARGLIALTPAPLPVLNVVPAAAPQAPQPVGMTLPMA
jgi:ATP-binding protein involved in chromosome partitioning